MKSVNAYAIPKVLLIDQRGQGYSCKGNNKRMDELGVEMSEEQVKVRIRTIRITYMAELRKIEKTQKCGPQRITCID